MLQRLVLPPENAAGTWKYESNRVLRGSVSNVVRFMRWLSASDMMCLWASTHTSMDGVFFKLAHSVYTISTDDDLHPWMLLCFTIWQHSSSTFAGMSSRVPPSGSLR